MKIQNLNVVNNSDYYNLYDQLGGENSKKRIREITSNVFFNYLYFTVLTSQISLCKY